MSTLQAQKQFVSRTCSEVYRRREVRPKIFTGLALLALRQNGFLQSLAQLVRQLVQLVAAVNLDRFARRVHRDHAVLTGAQVLFKVRP